MSRSAKDNNERHINLPDWRVDIEVIESIKKVAETVGVKQSKIIQEAVNDYLRKERQSAELVNETETHHRD